jgi:hypothetical protein
LLRLAELVYGAAVGELPSMDDILKDAKKREKRGDLRVGLLVVAGALAVMLGFNALGSTGGYTIYLVPGGALAFGMSRIVRGLS